MSAYVELEEIEGNPEFLRVCGVLIQQNVECPDGWRALPDGAPIHPDYLCVKSGKFLNYPDKPHRQAVFDYASCKWVIPESVVWGEVRRTRDALLKECDWRIVRAFEEGGTLPPEWGEYRQALRDVPEQPGAPHAIDWPVRPAA